MNVWRADAQRDPDARSGQKRTHDAPKREGVRINKYLADKGYCSRREADDWVAQGWVHVNGVLAESGQRVLESDMVTVAPAAQQKQAAKATILIHKPIGYVSAQAEDGYEPAIVLVEEQSFWRGSDDGTLDRKQVNKLTRNLKGFAVAGRLDIDSTGLLVLTQDGRIAKQLIGENSEVEKEYLVRVSKGDVELNVQAHVPESDLALLRHGLELDGVALKHAQVEWQNPEQLRFVLRQGKKRQIRRMCEQVGLTVTGLKRVRIGAVKLGKLPKGKWRVLGANERFDTA